jgi:hypothetical protein
LARISPGGASLDSLPRDAGNLSLGLFLGVIVSHPLALRRERSRPPVAGRAGFLKEVAAAVAELPTVP